LQCVFEKIFTPLNLQSKFVRGEPTLLTGSAGGIPPEPPFRPPRQKEEAERTISSFSLAANFNFYFCPLNAKAISTMVKALRTTNANTICHFVGRGFHKI
jgi:hypothetical protein